MQNNPPHIFCFFEKHEANTHLALLQVAHDSTQTET